MDEWKRTGAEFPTFAGVHLGYLRYGMGCQAWLCSGGRAAASPHPAIWGCSLPPDVLRSELMDVMGFHLGLKPPGVHSDFVPRREVAERDKILETNDQ